MNGKKAKNLRKLAGTVVGEKVSYFGDPKTVKHKEVKNLLGEVVYQYRTATYKLNACARVAYKMLKANYLSNLRAA